MATLTINGTDYQAKCAFAFDKMADDKYNEADGKGNKIGGFTNIYMNLLDESNRHLAAFWDCGLAHLKSKERPSVEEIENKLEELMEEEGAIEELFKSAFKTIDESGFYRKQVTKFWKNMESMKEMGSTDEQKAANQKAYEQLVETRENLLA